MRTISVVTVGRSDYGIYLPILRKLKAELRVHLLVSGAHLSPEFGSTIRNIEADGFTVQERVEMLLSSDSPEGIAKSIGLGVIGFAQVYARSRPDILLVLGDRFEMYAAVLAALPFKIPVAHIHGGEITQGAIDDALRHSITKLSHLHFVSTEAYGQRIEQLGEEPWRIHVTGAPSLDHLKSIQLLTAQELESRFGLDLKQPLLLVTFHPVTLEYEKTGEQITNLLSALEEVSLPILFTKPNADTSGRIIVAQIEAWIRNRPSLKMVDYLGTQAYFSLMSCAAAMVGNSSSGIIEAASFQLPVVNIGTRQQGRVRGINVIDVGYEKEKIVQGILRALQPEFRQSLAKMENPYDRGQAAGIIVECLKTVRLTDELVVKRFCDWPR